MSECSIPKITQDNHVVIDHCDVRENMIMAPEAVFNRINISRLYDTTFGKTHYKIKTSINNDFKLYHRKRYLGKINSYREILINNPSDNSTVFVYFIIYYGNLNKSISINKCQLSLEDVDLLKNNSNYNKYLVLSRKKSNNHHSSKTWKVGTMNDTGRKRCEREGSMDVHNYIWSDNTLVEIESAHHTENEVY